MGDAPQSRSQPQDTSHTIRPEEGERVLGDEYKRGLWKSGILRPHTMGAQHDASADDKGKKRKEKSATQCNSDAPKSPSKPTPDVASRRPWRRLRATTMAPTTAAATSAHAATAPTAIAAVDDDC